MDSRQHHVPRHDSNPASYLQADRSERNSKQRTIAGNAVNGERRRGNARLPNEPAILLNEAQSTALSGIEYAGWDISFLRERLFLDPEVVMHNHDDDRFGVLDFDGRIRIPDDLEVRTQRPDEATHGERQAHDLAYITV
jgi:hypothetical protein